MKEDWKKLKDFPEYSVSNLGNVRRNDTGKIISQSNSNGYKLVSLKNAEDSRKVIGVHRLVAQAFLKNPSNYPMVNHKDENPSNNCANNLEWCDAKYNANYGTAIQRKHEKALKRREGTEPLPSNIYDNIVNVCLKQKRRVVDVCAEAGVHPKAVAKWNKNIPSLLTAYKVASVLHVSLESFLK